MEFKPSLSASRLVSRLAVPDNLGPRVIHFSGPSFRPRMHHEPTTRPPIEFRHRSSAMKTRKTLAASHLFLSLSISLDSHPPLTFSLVNPGNLPSRRGSEDYSSPQLPGGDGFHRGEGGVMGDTTTWLGRGRSKEESRRLGKAGTKGGRENRDNSVFRVPSCH